MPIYSGNLVIFFSSCSPPHIITPLYCKRSKYWRISNMAEAALFIYSGGNREGNYLGCRGFFFFLSLPEKTKMRAWLGTATAGQKGQTRGPASAREADVRQEAKDAASCFFNDL